MVLSVMSLIMVPFGTVIARMDWVLFERRRAPLPRLHMSILGLHRITATVDAAQDDLDLSRRPRLRLVKKTVNFDHHVYHFYYGDARHTRHIWTTFPCGTRRADRPQVRVR